MVYNTTSAVFKIGIPMLMATSHNESRGGVPCHMLLGRFGNACNGVAKVLVSSCWAGATAPIDEVMCCVACDMYLFN
jgi:hypothetical protein